MLKTYTKEKLNESAKKLDSKAGSWACKTVFWTVVVGFSIMKLINTTGSYGMAIGKRDVIKIIVDDIDETEDC